MISERFRFPMLSLFTLVSLAPLAASHAGTERSFSLTISPFHLAMPIYEFTGEYALSPNFGVAAIGGYGSTELEYSDGSTKDIGILELGAQAAYYVLGDFQGGLQVGGEVLWIKPFLPKEGDVTVSVNGLAVGPMVGYKWVAGFGLTLFIQGGYEFVFAGAKAENSRGEEAEASGEGGTPLLNLNAGWSF
jgi:hypothetical protein